MKVVDHSYETRIYILFLLLRKSARNICDVRDVTQGIAGKSNIHENACLIAC